jgi:hypothetical protein
MSYEMQPGVPSQGPPPQAVQTSSMAIVSLVLGILAYPTACCYGVGLFPAFGAIVTGVIARQQIRNSRGLQSGEGLAIAGIVLGAILIVILFCAICAIMGLGLMGGEIETIFDEIVRELETA